MLPKDGSPLPAGQILRIDEKSDTMTNEQLVAALVGAGWRPGQPIPAHLVTGEVVDAPHPVVAKGLEVIDRQFHEGLERITQEHSTITPMPNVTDFSSLPTDRQYELEQQMKMYDADMRQAQQLNTPDSVRQAMAAAAGVAPRPKQKPVPRSARIPIEDRRAWIVARQGCIPFQKTYTLCEGAVTLVFCEISPRDLDAIYSRLRNDSRANVGITFSGSRIDPEDVERHLVERRAAVSLMDVTIGAETIDAEAVAATTVTDILKDYCNPVPRAPKGVFAFEVAEALKLEGAIGAARIWPDILATSIAFYNLIRDLRETQGDPDFSSAIGN